MRILFLVVCLMISVPALAQEAEPVSADALAERIELATKMHEIWPVHEKVEKGVEKAALRIPAAQRERFKAAMRKAIKMGQLEEDSIQAMAKTFTAPELEEMIRFYGSDIGKSVSSKVDAYQAALSPTYTNMIDRALMDIRTGNATGGLQ